MALLFLLPQFPFFLRKGRTFRQRAIINIVTGQIKRRNVFIFPKVFGWGVEKEAVNDLRSRGVASMLDRFRPSCSSIQQPENLFFFLFLFLV
jgi:hypothetical protein